MINDVKFIFTAIVMIESAIEQGVLATQALFHDWPVALDYDLPWWAQAVYKQNLARRLYGKHVRLLGDGR
jgi:hypothetical protein